MNHTVLMIFMVTPADACVGTNSLDNGTNFAISHRVVVAAGNQVNNMYSYIKPACRTVPPRNNKESNTMKQNKNMRKAGFTLVEIMIVVAIIGLLAAIAIPNFVKARATSQANACINNLRQLDAAVNQWALENKATTGQTVTTANLTPYIKLNSSSSLPGCPAGGAYTVTTVGAAPTCSLGNSVTPGHYLP